MITVKIYFVHKLLLITKENLRSNIIRHCTNVKQRNNNTPIYTNVYDRDIFSVLYINSHIRYDNTLPRDQSIVCPNTECPSHKTGKNKVSYVRYNPEALKHIYFCLFCDEEWKTA